METQTLAAPEKITIIGTGLIGGSIAASFRRVFPSTKIAGLSQGNDARVALELGLLDEEHVSIEAAAAGADIVFLTCPVSAMPAAFEQLSKVRQLGLITDCGSTKQSIIAAAKMHLGSAFDRFLPGHPIAGSERHGPAGASAHLFVKRNWLLSPQNPAQRQLVGRIKPLLEALGSQVKEVDAKEHDELFAEISHFPHWLVFAACYSIGEGPYGEAALTQSGAGLKDTTRIGASPAGLWTDIFIDNQVALLRSIERFEKVLAHMRDLLEKGDTAQLQEMIDKASRWRKLVT